MSPSAGWFVILASMACLCFAAGEWVGRGSNRNTRLCVGTGLLLLFAWTWLSRNPAVAVQVIPVGVLRYLEGVGSVPVFMLIVGVAWSRSRLRRQRRLVSLAAALGAIFFLQGGMWMIQSTPSSVMGHTIGVGPVMQSQEFTCVPAACATALNVMGVGTTEAEMAELTQTRAGTGATLIRAMDGLNRRLAGAGITAEMVEPTYDELRMLPMPALTPLHLEPTRRHMIVIVKLNERQVWIVDPLNGYAALERDEFERVYESQALVFNR